MRSRSKEEIMAAILEACNEPVSRSKIMYNTFLNFAQVNNYSFMLIKEGLLSHQAIDKTFITTDRGRNYLKIYHK
jgi:predicted transcriptional regulator